MKIIFLDIDGVLLTRRTMIATGRNWSAAEPDRVLCRLLQCGCDQDGTHIVISSTWRDTPAKCRAKLAEGGLVHCLHKTDWRTPVDLPLSPGGIYMSPTRGAEIRAWLKAHPETTDYRILDDEAHDFNEDPELSSRLLLCDPNNGADFNVLLELFQFCGLTRP